MIAVSRCSAWIVHLACSVVGLSFDNSDGCCSTSVTFRIRVSRRHEEIVFACGRVRTQRSSTGELVEMGKSGGGRGGLISYLFLRKYYEKTERVIALSAHGTRASDDPANAARSSPVSVLPRSSPFSVFPRFPVPPVLSLLVLFSSGYSEQAPRETLPSVVPRGFADIPSGSRRSAAAVFGTRGYSGLPADTVDPPREINSTGNGISFGEERPGNYGSSLKEQSAAGKLIRRLKVRRL